MAAVHDVDVDKDDVATDPGLTMKTCSYFDYSVRDSEFIEDKQRTG